VLIETGFGFVWRVGVEFCDSFEAENSDVEHGVWRILLFNIDEDLAGDGFSGLVGFVVGPDADCAGFVRGAQGVHESLNFIGLYLL